MYIGADSGRVRSRFGEQALRWADAVACDTATGILVEAPDLGRNPAHLRQLRTSIVSTVLREMLIIDGSPVESITDEVVQTVRDYARRGVQISMIFRTLRIGQAVIVGHFVQAIAGAKIPEESAEIQRVVNILLREQHAHVTAVEAEFTDEYENGLAASAATRIVTINKIVAGSIAEHEASDELGYPLHLRHVGVVAWSRGEPGSATDSAVRQAVLRLLSSAGAHHTLLVPVGASAVWAWGTVSPSFQPEQVPLPVIPHDVDVAVGEAGDGIAGFRSSHVEARAVERLLLLAARPNASGVTFHRDTALAILLAADVDAARVFLRRTLGGLVEQNARTKEIRETVRCYLDESRSLARTAERLMIARNTVTYRVHRAEELAGVSLATQHLLLHAALVLSDYIDADKE